MAGFRHICEGAEFALYLIEIEALLSELHGRSLLLSPADYRLAKSWFDRDLPLSCVLNGIRNAYSKKEVCSLRDCRHDISNCEQGESERPHLVACQVQPQKESQKTKHWGKYKNYKEYMSSPEWKQLSEFVKKRAGWKCQTCNSSIDLVAHHRSYEKGADESGENCIAICKRCHALIHQIKEDK